LHSRCLPVRTSFFWYLSPAFRPLTRPLSASAENCEVTLTDRRKDGSVVLDVLGEEVIYQVLATLEFSSDRRRSSVIVRCPDGPHCIFRIHTGLLTTHLNCLLPDRQEN
jgi:magnesium-transporting ATPase (P-type)